MTNIHLEYSVHVHKSQVSALVWCWNDDKRRGQYITLRQPLEGHLWSPEKRKYQLGLAAEVVEEYAKSLREMFDCGTTAVQNGYTNHAIRDAVSRAETELASMIALRDMLGSNEYVQD